jgi:1-acyl-sn-glycerol-3-phosphate acyltransferase
VTIFRSAIFLLYFAILSAAMSIFFLPMLMLPRHVAAWMPRRWCALTFWGLRVFARLDFEMRGQRPPRGVLVAAKHMSMWDTLALYYLLDDPAIVMKRELFNIPFYGWYARKAGMIAVDRDGHASALRRMAASANAAFAQGRSVLIFPEGTRKKPGAAPDYKPGVAGLYGKLGTACFPVALNSGQYWTGFVKKPGRIVLEFLEPIPPSLKRREFMELLQNRIETATDKLVAESRELLAK